MTRDELVNDIKKHILAELPLEDVVEEDIQADTPLFDQEGLGLDSLDAVELVVIMEKYYGVIINDPEVAKMAFTNLGILANYILDHRPAE